MNYSVSKLMYQASEQLASLDLPRLESYILLSHASGFPKEKLLAMKDEILSEAIVKKFFSLVERRKKGEPSAYILGKKEFYGRLLKVTPDVLIPRPDTEIIVEEALSIIKQDNLKSIYDLCTGSSAIILSIAAELLGVYETCDRPNAKLSKQYQFFASDICQKALSIAKENTQNYHLPITFFQGSLLEAMPEGLKVDLIATNPPYLTNNESDEKIAQGWIEPDLALRAGKDGLDLIRILAAQALDKLNKGGYLLIEASGDQMNAMQEWLESLGYIHCYRVCDLAGIERVLIGQIK